MAKNTQEENKQIDMQMLNLIARSAQGNQQAFRELYDLASPRLYALALSFVKDRDAAQDILQETFVQVWHRAGDYHGERGKVLTWLSSILRYRAIDALRRKKFTTDVDIEEIEQEDETKLNQPATSALAIEETGRLEKCLDSLANSQRTSITLAYYQGLTHEELALQLTTPIGTIKSRIRRGLVRLKECLEP